MRLPRFVWDRRHNVASLQVSYAHNIWHRREIEGLAILGYNATGRLARVVVLDPARLLPPEASERDVVRAVHDLLADHLRPADLAVIRSALERAG